MTFTEIQTEVKDRLGVSSTDASTRIGRLINQVYRDVTTSVGINPSRQYQTSGTTGIGSSFVTISGAEKVLRAWIEDVDGNVTNLDEVTLGELRKETLTSSDDVTRWAQYSHTADTVTIKIDVLAESVFTILVDVVTSVSDLSGVQEPAFPESFHDMLIAGVLAKEYRRKSDRDLAREEEMTFEKRLGELRLFIAKSNLLKIQQRGAKSVVSASSAIGGSGSSTIGQSNYIQTGLITFDRGSAVAPFAVDDTDAAVVTNLDADKLDGQHGSYYAVATAFADHSARHESGGADAIKLDDLAAPDDNTDLDASAAKHGLMPKWASTLISNLLDLLSSTRGYVLYRGASAWAALAPGTAGYYFKTGGAGADPSWGANTGDIAIASQAALDFIYASSASQFARLVKGTAFQFPSMNSAASAWAFRSQHVVQTATTLTGAQNNFAKDAGPFVITACNNASLLSLTGAAAGTAGDLWLVYAINSTVTFAHNSGSSDAGNKFFNKTTGGVTPLSTGGSALFEYDGTFWRLIDHEQGAWITIAYASGNFTASAGTWTVDAGDQSVFRYMLRGRTLHITFDITTTDVSNACQSLQITLPNGYSASSTTYAGYVRAADAGTNTTAHALCSGTTLYCRRSDGATWGVTAGDNTAVSGTVIIEID